MDIAGKSRIGVKSGMTAAVCSIEKHRVLARLPSDAVAAAAAVAAVGTVRGLFGTCTPVAFDRILGSLHNRNPVGKAFSAAWINTPRVR